MRTEIALLRELVEALDDWLDQRGDMEGPKFMAAEARLVKAGWFYRQARSTSDARLRGRG